MSMMNDTYKQSILNLIENSTDTEYLQAVFSFAETYPDRTPKDKEVACYG